MDARRTARMDGHLRMEQRRVGGLVRRRRPPLHLLPPIGGRLTQSADYGWHLTTAALPPDGEVVETLSEGGIQTTLKRSGSLWFAPDGSMYVYYTPQFWRHLSQTTRSEP